MSYQVIARKWRPQRFDDVVGQRGVTQTLRNALEKSRIAQSFVFAGPRGVGKTTTARILARALNCEQGPTADPCGICDACREIAEGRDIDVMEIDAATHTGIDNVREVIIAGLGMLPVRDRYKIFVIDEVHQLSQQSFNALLKSLEEPPPHVVFMMATTQLEKIPDTILSRSQVFEFRAIGDRAIAAQLRKIADAEGVTVDEAALALVARAAEGSMRDAESKLDQVIAFAGDRITVTDVSAVLGLVARDLLFDIIEAVVQENPRVILESAARAVESGYELHGVCRELSRLMRDLMVISLDPARLDDVEMIVEGERERIQELAKQFSREDLMRAFDLLSRAEAEIRTASEPRYSFEMALLRWLHLRKLTPLEDVIASLEKGGGPAAGSGRGSTVVDRRPASPTSGQRAPGRPDPGPDRAAAPSLPVPPSTAAVTVAPASVVPISRPSPPEPAAQSGVSQVPPSGVPTEDAPRAQPGDFKDAFLNEIRRVKKLLYGAVVAQAQKIQCEPDRIIFTFAPLHRSLRTQLEQNVPWLESMAETLAGRRIKVLTTTGPDPVTTAAAPAGAASTLSPPAASTTDRKKELKDRAMAEPGVQAMLDVFGADIRDVEEM